MHVSGISVDLNWYLQLIGTLFILAVGLLYLVKNTASKYFVVEDANFDSSVAGRGGSAAASMPGVIGTAGDACVVCGNSTTKHCAGCKIVRYCSEACQISHWNSGHKRKCTSVKVNLQGSRSWSGVALVAARGTSKIQNKSQKILFPYDEFVELFNWEKPGFPPCGLLNCGNSCFANVVLQCLSYTRPLVAYLLEKGHRSECRRNGWCFLCELQDHVVKASQTVEAFSPINILSRLPTIGGNLGYGKQEDAHEFMRFAIDTMQSICLDQFGGEKTVPPSIQETTLIQHIFGGHLQSQVICTKCDNVSDQFENMMDLTVEIQGDCSSLEECLVQFTDKERLHGDNKYKCDGCNDYVLAWKRLTIRRAPNILTIALKRFQTGRFGKLNKRVTFPETLNLSPYMSGGGDGNDVYKLYAVVVHVDMLNASFFGHYICYTKDFSGNWYKIDDCKVCAVELDEVLLQGAYMLLYSRVCARESCLNFFEEPSRKDQEMLEGSQEVLPSCPKQPGESAVTVESARTSGSLRSNISPEERVSSSEEQLTSVDLNGQEDVDMVVMDACSSRSKNIAVTGDGRFDSGKDTSFVEHGTKSLDGTNSSSEISTGTSVLKCESPFAVSNVENGNGANENGAAECVSVNPLIEGDVATTQNRVNVKVETECDVSVSTSSIGEKLYNLTSVHSPSSKLEKSNVGKSMPTPSATQDAVQKSDRTISSGAKLKPIFAPGFLGKRPRNRNIIQEEKSRVPSHNLKPGLSHHAGGHINGEQNSDHKFIASTSAQKGDKVCNVRNNGEQNSYLEPIALTSTQKGDEGCHVADMGAIDSLHLSNGVAFVPDESIMDIVVKDEKSLVEEASSGPSKLEQHTG